jgi:hypothetical protein
VHVLFLILELSLLAGAIVGLLVLVGFGPVALAVPELGGAALLATPFVGLGILYWVCQWLSPHFASGPIVIVTCIAFGLLSALQGWRRRRLLADSLRRARIDVLFLGTISLAFLMLVQVKVLTGGALTLTSIGGDDLFTWSPSATFMQSHSFALGQGVTEPTLWLLPTNIYPGSAGTVDGGLLSIFHMQGYQLVDVFTAVCLALGACAVYGLLRSALHAPKWVAVLGFLLACVTESRSDIAILGLAQAARGGALMIAAIWLFVLAFERRSAGLAVLSGGLMAVLCGVYMQTFLVAVAAAAGGLLFVVVRTVRRGLGTAPWRLVVAFVTAGIVFGIQNIWWLIFQGGLHAWVLQTHYAKTPSIESFSQLAGTSPLYLPAFAPATSSLSVSHLFFFWNGAWNVAGVAAGVLAVGLVLIGVWAMARRRPLAAATLGAPLLYGCVVFVAELRGSGAGITVLYLLPIAVIFASYGVAYARGVPLTSVRRHPMHGRARTYSRAPAALLAAVVGFIVLLQVASTSQLTAFALQQKDLLPPGNLALSALASKVPVGSDVLIYSVNSSTNTATYRKTRTLVDALIFLPDRNVTMAGTFFSGRFTEGDGHTISAELADDYRFVLHEEDSTIRDPAVPTGYHVIWRSPSDHLTLFERSDS